MQEILVLNLDQCDKDMVDAFETYKKRMRDTILRSHASSDPPSMRFLQSDNGTTCFNAINNTNRIVHMLGHGHPLGMMQSRNKTGTRVGNFRWRDFADAMEDWELHLAADCLILDSCYSSGLLWRTQIQRMVPAGKELIVIGSAFKLPFYQSEFFFFHFYWNLLSRPLADKRAVRLQRIRDAFNFAQDAYREEHGRRSRLRIMEFSG